MLFGFCKNGSLLLLNHTAYDLIISNRYIFVNTMFQLIFSVLWSTEVALVEFITGEFDPVVNGSIDTFVCWTDVSAAVQLTSNLKLLYVVPALNPVIL